METERGGGVKQEALKGQETDMIDDDKSIQDFPFVFLPILRCSIKDLLEVRDHVTQRGNVISKRKTLQIALEV
jgi:hypothetical protein